MMRWDDYLWAARRYPVQTALITVLGVLGFAWCVFFAVIVEVSS